MQQIADDVRHLPLAPRDAINAYLVGDVLVDAGYARTSGRLLRALAGRQVRDHVLTHAHLDHAGGSARICRELGLAGVGVGAADAEAARSGDPEPPPHAPVTPLARRIGRFPAVPVARELREGDEVGPGFVVLETPGHTPGSVALWREDDRVLLCGDVFFGMNVLTTAPGVREPVRAFSTDPALNRRSARRLAALGPALVAFGHGPVLRDPGVLEAFAASLPLDHGVEGR